MGRVPQSHQLDAVVFGDANVDIVGYAATYPPEGNDVQLAHASLEPGGAGGNVAVGLARLGYRVCLRARLGRDLLARWLLGRLREQQVITRFIDSSSRPTGLVFVAVTAAGQRTMFSARSANLSLRARDLLPWAGIVLLYASGYALGASAPEEIGRALEACRRKGSKVVLEVGTLLAASGWSSLRAVFDSCDTVLLADTELRKLGTPREGIMSHLARDNSRVFVVHAGARGCEVLTAATRIACAAVPTPVVDSTGAGDAFGAGYCAGMLEGYDTVQAARLGNLVAALKLRGVGAQRALPSRIEVRRFIRANRGQPWVEGLEGFGSHRRAR